LAASGLGTAVLRSDEFSWMTGHQAAARWRRCRSRQGVARRKRLEAAEELVEFVGGLEVGFQLAGGQTLAEVVDALGQEIERGG
jgi:hypothetical protein